MQTKPSALAEGSNAGRDRRHISPSFERKKCPIILLNGHSRLPTYYSCGFGFQPWHAVRGFRLALTNSGSSCGFGFRPLHVVHWCRLGLISENRYSYLTP
jgi:hypothetical protein